MHTGNSCSSGGEPGVGWYPIEDLRIALLQMCGTLSVVSHVSAISCGGTALDVIDFYGMSISLVAVQLMQGIYASLEDSYAPARRPASSVPQSGAQSPPDSEMDASADSIQVQWGSLRAKTAIHTRVKTSEAQTCLCLLQCVPRSTTKDHPVEHVTAQIAMRSACA